MNRSKPSLSAYEIRKLIVQNLKVQLRALGYDVETIGLSATLDGSSATAELMVGGRIHKIKVTDLEEFAKHGSGKQNR